MEREVTEKSKRKKGSHVIALMLLMAASIMCVGLTVHISLGWAENTFAWIIPAGLLPFIIAFIVAINIAKKTGRFDISPEAVPLAIIFFPTQALVMALIKWSGISGPNTSKPIVGLLVVCTLTLLASPFLNKFVAKWLCVPNAMDKNYNSGRSVE